MADKDKANPKSSNSELEERAKQTRVIICDDSEERNLIFWLYDTIANVFNPRGGKKPGLDDYDRKKGGIWDDERR